VLRQRCSRQQDIRELVSGAPVSSGWKPVVVRTIWGVCIATTVGRRSHTHLSLPGRRSRIGRRSSHLGQPSIPVTIRTRLTPTRQQLGAPAPSTSPHTATVDRLNVAANRIFSRNRRSWRSAGRLTERAHRRPRSPVTPS
jgi:hypothetical protein